MDCVPETAYSPRFVFMLALLVTPLAACAHHPPLHVSGSAAALSEPELARAPIARASQEDPPLPGQMHEGWEGLQQPAGAAAHAGHHHHIHMAPAQ